MNKTLYYTWIQFDKDCEHLARWAKRFDFKNVYGIPRAGVFVAARLSYLLDIPLIVDPHDIEHPNTLVADDIMRTGQTAAVLEEHIGDFIIATLVWTGGSSEPDFYARKKSEIVIFPWHRNTDALLENPTTRALAAIAQIRAGGSIKVDKKGMA